MSAPQMKLSELRAEIERIAKSPYGDKLYPMTSGWVPVTDVLTIVDRLERQSHRQVELILQDTGLSRDGNSKALLLRIITALLS
jgi:hypothetical protein